MTFDEMKSLPKEDQKKLFSRLKSARHDGKQVNYSAVYGVGALTMSRNTGKSKEECQALLDAYWGKNWSVKKISDSCKVRTVNGQMWLYNPVSTFWYSLRYKKDKFSTLNQGTATYCFDMWVKKSREKGIMMCGQFHDETVSPLKPYLREDREIKLRNAIAEVNDFLKLNRDLDIDVQFGFNYGMIH